MSFRSIIMNSKRLLIGFRSDHQCRAEDALAYRMRSNFNWCFWEGSCTVFNNNSITVIDSSIEHRADVNATLHQDSMVMSHWHCLDLVLLDRAWIFYKSSTKQKDYGCCASEAQISCEIDLKSLIKLKDFTIYNGCTPKIQRNIYLIRKKIY